MNSWEGTYQISAEPMAPGDSWKQVVSSYISVCLRCVFHHIYFWSAVCLLHQKMKNVPFIPPKKWVKMSHIWDIFARHLVPSGYIIFESRYIIFDSTYFLSENDIFLFVTHANARRSNIKKWPIMAHPRTMHKASNSRHTFYFDLIDLNYSITTLNWRCK